MPPPRPYWKGYLKLSLVTCPVALYSATSASEKISFRQINRQTGNRLKQQMIDEQSGDIVESVDKGRGYEVEKGVYLPIEDEELEAIAIESNHTIDIDGFVPKAEIDERYIDSPYYIAPNDKPGLEAFAVIRDAMADKGVAALGRVVLAKRERVLMLQPWGAGLLGTTLRYAYEVRAERDYFGDIAEVKIPTDMLQLAGHIIDSKKAAFDAAGFHDRFEEAVIDMIKAKKAGLPARPQQTFAPRAGGPTDLFAILRQSLANENANKPKAANANKSNAAGKPKKRVAGQRELLLPIAGGGKATAKPVAVAASEMPAAKRPARKKAS